MVQGIQLGDDLKILAGFFPCRIEGFVAAEIADHTDDRGQRDGDQYKGKQIGFLHERMKIQDGDKGKSALKTDLINSV